MRLHPPSAMLEFKTMGPENKVLLVDDERTQHAIVQLSFEQIGIMPTVVNNLDDARREIARGIPNMIILDIFFPHGNGLAFFREIRENPETSEVPVLFVSTADEAPEVATREPDPSRAYTGFIRKPFSPKTLIAETQRILESGAGTFRLGA